MSLEVWIGHDSRWPTVTDVAVKSLKHYASAPVNVNLLDPAKLPKHPGGSRTQFSMLRFLIPHLMNYKGVALYVDQDVVFLDDAAKLFAEAPTGHWSVACVQHAYQSTVNCPNWASVMLLNCANLTQWALGAYQHESRQWFHEFQSVPRAEIAPLHPRWNRLDYLTGDDGILHLTSGTPVDAGKVGERPHGKREFELWREWERK